jgi:uncharacterized protein (DUF736 family)
MIKGLIGRFSLARNGGWTGCVRTLAIDAKMQLVPNDNRDAPNAPIFRAMVGQFHVGDAWAARSAGAEPRDYLRVRLDDPSLGASINAALFPDEDGQTANLIWRRRARDA